MGGGGQGRCEQRSKVFAKIEKKIMEGVGLGGGGVWFWGARVDVDAPNRCLYIKESTGGGGGASWGGGGQDGCERRIKVFVKIQKKIFFFWGGGVRSGRRGGGRERKGVGLGGGGQGGCERSI